MHTRNDENDKSVSTSLLLLLLPLDRVTCAKNPSPRVCCMHMHQPKRSSLLYSSALVYTTYTGSLYAGIAAFPQ